MTVGSTSFHFTDGRPAADDATLVIRIPARINRKRRLLAEYARQLRLPNYFGWNWDAFEECLRDLTWLDGIKQVIVVHRDLPFAESTEQQATYLSILRDRLEWTHPRCPHIQIVFPLSAQWGVNQVLGKLLSE